MQQCCMGCHIILLPHSEMFCKAFLRGAPNALRTAELFDDISAKGVALSFGFVLSRHAPLWIRPGL